MAAEGSSNQTSDAEPLDRGRSINSKSENAQPREQRPSAGNSKSTWRKITSRRPSQRHPPEPTSRPQPPRLDGLPQRPNFSLAGPSSHGQAQHNAPFVEKGYRQLNPNYDVPAKKPVWGLAKPLPRVVRPGMRRGEEDGKEDGKENGTTAVETQEPQGAEAIPQVDMIPSQRRESGLPQEAPSVRSRTSSTSQHNKQLERGKQDGNRVDSGTPTAEIGNPMDGWFPAQQQTKRTDSRGERQREENRRTYEHYANIAASNDALDGDLDAKLQWAADNDDLDEFELDEAEHDYNPWSSIRRKYKEPLAECLGTMVAFLIGIGSSLSVMTSSDQAGNYQSTNWAWGLGITLGIYIAGGVSGGHLNPAISLLLSIYRGFPIRKACVYILAQIFGAFLAGLIAFAVYRPAIYHYSPTSSLNPDETGTAFYLSPKTWPGGGVGVGFSFLTEFVATAILGVTILALGDDSNAPPGAGMHALIVGFIVTAVTMAFGYTSGCGMNPARDLGPRMAAAAVGYGKGVFQGNSVWWLWGVWGGEITGALFGGFVYDAAVFVGGESPVNFPSRKWRRRKVKDKVSHWAARKLEEGKG